MIISVSASFLPERRYIINTVFKEFLGLDFEFKVHEDRRKYAIIVPGGGELIIEDDFFSRYSEPAGYLHKVNIPESVMYFGNNFPEFKNTPILFGSSGLNIDGRTILVGADIFASAFYMLTRWEEYVISDRDSHGRFPATSSIAYKYNFLDRPVVNEYADLIWELLLQVGYKGQRGKRNYTIVPTHDIDKLLYWDKTTRLNLLKNISGDIFKRQSPVLASRKIKNFWESGFDFRKDQNYSFNYFMELSEKSNVKANFYFMAGGEKPYDPDIYVKTAVFKNIVSEINERGHIIGIHPSYISFNNPVDLQSEVNRLEESVNMPVKSGRQHYLRFEVPATWQAWDECQLETDSSMYYSGHPGFRCGTCYDFPVFDILQRKPLNLREMPLLVMDTCLLNNGPDAAADRIRKLKSEVRKHHGNFVFVWHNSNTFSEPLKRFKPIFEREFYG